MQWGILIVTVNKSRIVSDERHAVLYPLITSAIPPYESMSQAFLYCHMWHYNRYLVTTLFTESQTCDSVMAFTHCCYW